MSIKRGIGIGIGTGAGLRVVSTIRHFTDTRGVLGVRARFVLAVSQLLSSACLRARKNGQLRSLFNNYSSNPNSGLGVNSL